MNGELHSRLPIGNEGDDIEKVARAVNLMLDEIERLLDQLKSVGDNIAHDLRTPLMVARSKIVRVLEEETDIGVPARGDGSGARPDRPRLRRPSPRFCASRRWRTGRGENRFTDFDLGAVCVEVAEFYEPFAASKAIELAVEARDPVPMRGDEDLMREAISNLVDNADQVHARGRQGAGRGGDLDGLPRLAVSDTGPRRSVSRIAIRIFRRFYRGEGAENVPGHGLGLSIAQTIANLHGFQLTVEDNSPGARFVMHATAKASLVSPAPHE